jgi:hypothetical protein
LGYTLELEVATWGCGDSDILSRSFSDVDIRKSGYLTDSGRLLYLEECIVPYRYGDAYISDRNCFQMYKSEKS